MSSALEFNTSPTLPLLLLHFSFLFSFLSPHSIPILTSFPPSFDPTSLRWLTLLILLIIWSFLLLLLRVGKRVQRAYVRTDSGLRGSISVYDLIDEMIDVDVVNLADYIQVRILFITTHPSTLSTPSMSISLQLQRLKMMFAHMHSPLLSSPLPSSSLPTWLCISSDCHYCCSKLV